MIDASVPHIIDASVLHIVDASISHSVDGALVSFLAVGVMGHFVCAVLWCGVTLWVQLHYQLR
jgi:hypothetical protein